MIRTMRFALVPFALVAVLVLAACGGGEKSTFSSDEGAFGLPAPPGAPFATPAPAVAPQFARAEAPVAVREVMKVVVEREVEMETAVIKALPIRAGAPPAPAAVADDGGSIDEEAALVSQQRIIVRTVDMGLVVNDVSQAINNVTELAKKMGGWLVSSDHSQKHRGFVSVRVPADRLDESVRGLRGMAEEVESEVSTSRDVTDEYVDTSARIRNLEATEEALFALMRREGEIKDILAVRQELTNVQGEIERLQGRIKLLEQTSAFSLLNVGLRLAPAEMEVDAGEDQTFSVGRVARFRASFKPPEDIEEFSFTWDFGDGSRQVTGNRTAPTLDDDKRVTATVTHVYADDRESPYIVEIEMMGFGDAGVVEGSDTIIATVTKVPTIEVFAGESKVVEEDEEFELIGSFTRPEGLTELSFRWDFGDGSPPVSGSLADGVTNAVAEHEYADHRPLPFTATLTVTGQSDAGEVEGMASLLVLVTEADRYVLSGWSAGDTWKSATRALSGVGQVLGTAAIFLLIFSPVWVIVGAIAVVAVRRWRGRARVAGEATSA